MNTSQDTLVIKLKSEIQSLSSEVTYLKEQISWFQRQIFGRRSEKIVKCLNDNVIYPQAFREWYEAEGKKEEELKKLQTLEEKSIAAHTRVIQKKDSLDKISYPDNLPVERIELDVTETKKVCQITGKPLVKIGEEVSRKLAHKPGCYFIKEYVRPKYSLSEEEGIITAEMPDSIIPKCRVDESLLAEILTDKFADHLPHNRISDRMSRDGIKISRQLLSQWTVRIGQELKPLYDVMRLKILESKNVFADESPVEMLDPGKGKTHQAYMWILAGGCERDPPYRIYQFHTTRKHENAIELIGDYKGVLHSDKYGAYEVLANRKQLIWCPCWSHIRRKFENAESGDPKFRAWVLEKIQELFVMEQEAWELSPEERVKIRREKEEPVIDELIKNIKDLLVIGKLLPKSKFREALGYFYGLIPHLKNYINHPWARLDNNVAERAVRPLAVGRKNWLFVGSPKGGESAAVIFSLIQTCRALKINPRDYLEDIFRKIMGYPHSKIEDLLPDNWAKSRI